jgi:hypothetical protein
MMILQRASPPARPARPCGTGRAVLATAGQCEVPARRVSITCLESSFPEGITGTMGCCGHGYIRRCWTKSEVRSARPRAQLVPGNEEDEADSATSLYSSVHDSTEQRAISSQGDLRSLSNKFQLELQLGPIGTVHAARLQDAANGRSA